MAAQWWDPQGPSRPLHDLNPVRLAWVQEQRPLRGLDVLDVGCGGGLFSEAMAAAGARVTAIDLSEPLLEVARLHALESGRVIDYRLDSVETLADQGPQRFDLISCMELIEHVPDPQSVLDACARLLRPGGLLCLSTLNRSLRSFLAAIVGAEYLLGLLPRGTHDYRRFIRPSELAAGLRRAGLEVCALSGLNYEPFTRRAWLSDSVAVNYLISARRP